MIIKSRDFIQYLNRNLWQITINKNFPLIPKGSFMLTDMNSIITDLDFTANVRFNDKLVEIIHNLLSRLKYKGVFVFIHMKCGKTLNYPWKIDKEGGCDFNTKLVIEWLTTVKEEKTLDDSAIQHIDKFINKDEVSIKDLVDLELQLDSYTQIIWKEEDIKAGKKVINGKEYNLLENMKLNTSVLKYIIIFNDDVCSLDVGLVDRNYPSAFQKNMYHYYTENWYSIFKMYKYLLSSDGTPTVEYLNDMRKIRLLNACKNQLKIVKKNYEYRFLSEIQTQKIFKECNFILKQYNIINLTKDTDLSKVIHDIEYKVNCMIKDRVLYYKDKLVKRKDQYEIYYQRTINGIKQVTYDEIGKRLEEGIKCPFFATDIEEFTYFYNLSKKANKNVNVVLDCIQTISIEYGLSISEIIGIYKLTSE